MMITQCRPVVMQLLCWRLHMHHLQAVCTSIATTDEVSCTGSLEFTSCPESAGCSCCRTCTCQGDVTHSRRRSAGTGRHQQPMQHLISQQLRPAHGLGAAA